MPRSRRSSGCERGLRRRLDGCLLGLPARVRGAQRDAGGGEDEDASDQQPSLEAGRERVCDRRTGRESRWFVPLVDTVVRTASPGVPPSCCGAFYALLIDRAVTE